MLRLEKVEICGFKSFSDRTEVLLPAGITAVVGPNGCGKSNIGDAINWVLGEQSPKMLRGKQMADVIFNGSAARKPNGMAEVTLCLQRLGRPDGGAEAPSANGNGAGSEPSGAATTALPPGLADGAEIRITRRLFRSGESEYLINGRRSRLKDIQEILRNERVGAKTYATIEQGRIDQILNAKPKDRRLVIEEAAGIAGFKHKRRLTEMKLEATEANLLRVQDVIREVTRQINSLKRQAAKARRYKRHREDLRGLLQLRYAARARELDTELETRRRRETELRTAEAEGASALSTREAALAEGRRELDRREEEYRALSEELHGLDLELDRAERARQTAIERIEEAGVALERAGVEERQIHERIGSWTARRQEQEAIHADHARDIEERRARLEGRQHEWAELQRALSEARSTLDRLGEEQLRATHARAEARNRLDAVRQSLRQNEVQRARLARQRDETRADRLQLVSEAQRLDETRTAHVGDLDRLTEEATAAERRLASLRDDQRQALQASAAAREEAKSAQARLHTLQDVAHRFGGETDGTRAILSRAPDEGIRTAGVVADYVDVDPEFERAAESYLAELLPAVIVEGSDDAKRSAALLGREGAAATRLLCRALPAKACAVGAAAERMDGDAGRALREDPRVLGRLRDRMRLDTRANGALQGRIGDAFLVTDLDAALDLHSRHDGFDFLTPTGEVVYTSGVIAAGGGGESADGVLAHTRKIHEARTKLEEAEARVERARRIESDAAQALEEGRETWESSRDRLEEARRRKVEVDLRAQRLVEDRERSERQTEVVEQEWARLAADDRRFLGEREAASALVEESEGSLEAIERRVEEARAEVARIGSRVEEAAEAVGAAREDLAARSQRQEALGHELARLGEALREARERLDVVRGQAEQARERSRENLERRTRNETTLAELSARREERSKAALAMEREIRERRRAVQEHEGSLSKERAALESLRENSRQAEIERTRVESEREHLAGQALEEFGQPLEMTLTEVDAAELEATDLVDLEAKIEELKGKIDRIGPVNILAIDEFSDLEERQRFLSEQKEDLEKSMASLKETIRKINRNSRDRFMEAFETIRENYREIYKSLFNGGRADLRLEEDSDVLEAGIEIFSQPPGKRLGSVQLLSGGEKAMSAIALLFAIFRYQPSPFCLLDEVDAPLDDINVGRFTRMLRDYASHTQFILITHNKLSMESADLLYGVTMEEPGVSRLMSMQLQ